MSINLDTEVVATSFLPAERACLYTIARNGKRWTVKVPLADLDRHGADKGKRRAHLVNVLDLAMRGEPDPPPGEPNVPA